MLLDVDIDFDKCGARHLASISSNPCQHQFRIRMLRLRRRLLCSRKAIMGLFTRKRLEGKIAWTNWLCSRRASLLPMPPFPQSRTHIQRRAVIAWEDGEGRWLFYRYFLFPLQQTLAHLNPRALMCMYVCMHVCVHLSSEGLRAREPGRWEPPPGVCSMLANHTIILGWMG